MPRRVQDIVPADRRTIRDVPMGRETEVEPVRARKSSRESRQSKEEEHIPIHVIDKSSKKRLSKKEEEDEAGDEQDDDSSSTAHEGALLRRMPITPPPDDRAPRRKKSGRSKKWILAVIAVVVVVAATGFVASAYFSRATFKVIPKAIPVTVNGTFVAQNTPGNVTAGSVPLIYELASVRGTATSTVAASDGPQTSTKAQGKITLYNGFSTASQKLIAGTRFADDSGRIYRLNASVVIPGRNGSSTPGSIAAMVVADQPGQQYNASPGDGTSNLKIVAYKGTTKYDTIYARITSNITGGFIGTKKIVSPSVVASTTADLKAALTLSLLNQVKSVVPSGYIMYSTAYVTTFAPVIIGGTDQNKAAISLQGTLYGILFKKSDLVARLAGERPTDVFGSFSYTTPGLESLDFSIANAKDFSPEKKGSLIIKLKGNMKLLATVPVDELKKVLAGVSLAETQTIFKKYAPVIESGSGELVPPWSKVPTDLKRISIEVEE